MEVAQQFGLNLIRSLQTWSPALDGPMVALSFLGGTEFLLFLGALIYWTMDKRLGLRLMLLVVLAYTLSWVFKLLFHQPRPYWVGGVMGLATEATYGIPSGHAALTSAVWIYLAWYFRRRWLWAVAAAMILAVALSRLFLGVHFPHDILFGWLIGAAAAWIVARAERRTAAWAGRQRLTAQIGVGLGLSLVLVLIGRLTPMLIAGVADPPAWAAYAGQARSPETLYAAAGLLFGAVTGYALMRRYADFEAGGAWPRRIGRYALGLAGVVGIYAVLRGLPATTVLAAVVALWIFFAAPWAFLKARLAQPGEASLASD